MILAFMAISSSLSTLIDSLYLAPIRRHAPELLAVRVTASIGGRKWNTAGRRGKHLNLISIAFHTIPGELVVSCALSTKDNLLGWSVKMASRDGSRLGSTSGRRAHGWRRGRRRHCHWTYRGFCPTGQQADSTFWLEC
jgi:hypothetical protein